MEIVNCYFDPISKVFWNAHDSISLEDARKLYGELVDVDFFKETNQHKEIPKREMKEKPTIDDIGNESYRLYLHYKNDNHVLFIGAFAATGWIKNTVKGYLENDPYGTLTFTMVEI